MTTIVTKTPPQQSHYLGGIASCCSTCLTHPLDTIKIHLQTQKQVQFGFIGLTKHVIKTNGALTLYNGLSAAVLMSATYSTSRFAFYGYTKDAILTDRRRTTTETTSINTSKTPADLTFVEKLALSAMSGVVGSVFGTPADLCNIRMQNDVNLPIKERRNYANAFEAIGNIWRTEGFGALYTGFSLAVSRAVLATVGQLAFYDEFKSTLIYQYHMKDDLTCYLVASMGAGFIATFLTMPVDVTKTILMNAKPGEYSGILDVTRSVLRHDKFGLFKGFYPRYIRFAPSTTCTFLIYEELKKRF